MLVNISADIGRVCFLSVWARPTNGATAAVTTSISMPRTMRTAISPTSGRACKTCRLTRDKTSLVITTDHGRGTTRINWTDHGKDVPLAEFIWIAVMGPDTPALGVRENIETTQSQVAATIAYLLGEDFSTASPKAAAALPEARLE